MSTALRSSQAYFPPERPEIDACVFCGQEGWCCLCIPSKPHRKPTAAEIEQARESRLTRAEHFSETDGR